MGTYEFLDFFQIVGLGFIIKITIQEVGHIERIPKGNYPKFTVYHTYVV